MQIAEHCVATFHYTLTDDAGTVIDSSSGREPLAYLHGAGNIVPGLERA
ncbi:MAG: peptidylprolyl isomerase, partial [Gammaproteobacteria bacterium HGW-Gammaproteobacteria-2]